MKAKNHKLSNRHKSPRNLMAGNLKSRAQSSFEYLMIIALTVAIIVPMTYLFFRYSADSNTKILDSQINQIGRNMVDTAESVFFSGEDSKIVLELNMPDNVIDVYIIDERELIFNVTTTIGVNEVVFFSDVNITSNSCLDEKCSLTEIATSGLKKVKFLSVNEGKEILISLP